MDTTLQALRLQARLDLDRAVGTVRPDPLARVGEIEHIVQLLTVMHGRIRRIPFADQLVRLVHADMVLKRTSANVGVIILGLSQVDVGTVDHFDAVGTIPAGRPGYALHVYHVIGEQHARN